MSKDEALNWMIENHKLESLQQPTNMVTIPLDKLEDMQRRLKEQPTTEQSSLVQEPYAWMNDIAFSMDKDELTTDKFGDIIPLYTTPPSREWQSLSDDEINLIYPCTGGEYDFKDIARAIEAKLKEKNNG